MSRAFKVFKGSTLKTLVLLANIAVLFFLIPFIIKSIGDELYGLWTLISSLSSYYFLMDFGISQCVSRFIARAIGKRKEEEISSTLTNGVFIFAVIGVFILAITAILVLSLGFFTPGNLLKTSQILVTLVGVEIALSLPLRAYQGVLTANLDYGVISGFELLRLVLSTTLVVYCLSSGYGILALGFINFSADLVALFLSYLYIRARYGYARLRFDLVSRKKSKELYDFSKYVFLNNVGDTIRSRLDSVIITSYMGLPYVTVYFIANKIIDYFRQIMISATEVINPLLSQYEGARDYDAIRDKYILGVRFSSILSFFIGANLIIFGRFFIRNWMGDEYLAAYGVLVVLSAGFTAAMMQRVGMGVLQSLNKHKFFAAMTLTEAICNIGLSIILIQKWGLIGQALGTAIPLLLIKMIVQPLVVCRQIGISINFFLKQTAGLVVAQLLVYASVYLVIVEWLKIESLSYISMALLISAEGTVIAILTYFILLNKSELGYVKMLRTIFATHN